MLLESGIGGLRIQQEVSVRDIWPAYVNGRDKFDYYLPQINLVVELHGEQHYKPVNFGGVSDNAATQNYIRRVKVDERKAIAAKKAGLTYISFRYDDDITKELLFSKIKEAEALPSLEEETPEAIDQEKEDFRKRVNKENRERNKELRRINKERDKAYRASMKAKYLDTSNTKD